LLNAFFCLCADGDISEIFILNWGIIQKKDKNPHLIEILVFLPFHALRFQYHFLQQRGKRINVKDFNIFNMSKATDFYLLLFSETG